MSLKKIIKREVQIASALTAYPPLLQRIFSARGITEPAQLEMDLNRLETYQTLKDIDKAVNRLYQALTQQQRVLIIGDFDADGATSTALAVSALKAFGFRHVQYLVPNRFEQGYGLSPAIVELAAEQQPDLIITVDNGIASLDGVTRANELGIDVLITDHHISPDVLPPAIAIINPNQPGCRFDSKSIAGVGVIFYVMLAFRRKLVDENYFALSGCRQPNMASLLDLVALGTVADVVSLDKNNRALVMQGLARIRARQCRPGILALLDIGKRDPAFLQAMDLGYVVGPRLNAAGRLDDMSLGIACLLSDNYEQAYQLARTLDELNQERRQIEDTMKQEAFDVIKRLHLNDARLPLGLCLYDPSWHQGVIGIVAGRLKERYHRPTIIFADGDEGMLKGSARSVDGVHIRDVLDAVSKKYPALIDKFGGHAMAAGLSIAKANLEAFKEAFVDEISSHLTEEACISNLFSDGELQGHELTLDTALLLENAAPWGQHFPKPLFDNVFRIIEQRLLAGRHLKMTLQLEGDPNMVDAIAFNIGSEQWPNHRAQRVYCAYHLDVNRYQGRSRLQLMVEHLEVIS